MTTPSDGEHELPAPEAVESEPDEIHVMLPFTAHVEAGMGIDYDPDSKFMHALLVLDLHVLEQTDDEPPRHVLYRVPMPAEQAIGLAEMIIAEAKIALTGTSKHNARRN